MMPIIVAVVVILFIAIALALMIKYASNQSLRCPHCGLEFDTDLFLVQNHALLVCPFCQQWILATKSTDKYVAKKLFAGKSSTSQ